MVVFAWGNLEHKVRQAEADFYSLGFIFGLRMAYVVK
jgi:hypothetical protein